MKNGWIFPWQNVSSPEGIKFDHWFGSIYMHDMHGLRQFWTQHLHLHRPAWSYPTFFVILNYPIIPYPRLSKPNFIFWNYLPCACNCHWVSSQHVFVSVCVSLSFQYLLSPFITHRCSLFVTVISRDPKAFTLPGSSWIFLEPARPCPTFKELGGERLLPGLPYSCDLSRVHQRPVGLNLGSSGLWPMSCDLAVGSCPCFGISWYIYVCISGCTGFGGVRLVEHSQAGKSSWSSCSLIELLQDRSIHPPGVPPGELLQAIQIYPKSPSKSSYSPPIWAQPVVVCGASQRAMGEPPKAEALATQEEPKAPATGEAGPVQALSSIHSHGSKGSKRPAWTETDADDLQKAVDTVFNKAGRKQWWIGGGLCREKVVGSQRAKIWGWPRRVAHVKRAAFTVDMSKKHNIILNPSNLLGTAGLYYPLHYQRPR